MPGLWVIRRPPVGIPSSARSRRAHLAGTAARHPHVESVTAQRLADIGLSASRRQRRQKRSRSPSRAEVDQGSLRRNQRRERCAGPVRRELEGDFRVGPRLCRRSLTFWDIHWTTFGRSCWAVAHHAITALYKMISGPVSGGLSPSVSYAIVTAIGAASLNTP